MLQQDKPIRETSTFMPSLSTQGWITSMGEKVDRSFAYYVTSQYSQTLYHKGHVRSLQYSVQKYYQEPIYLAKQIKEDLETLLKDYIDYVDVKVDYKENNDGPEVDYTIEMILIHAGYKWSNFKSVRTKGSLFEEIISINNQGVSLV